MISLLNHGPYTPALTHIHAYANTRRLLQTTKTKVKFKIKGFFLSHIRNTMQKSTNVAKMMDKNTQKQTESIIRATEIETLIKLESKGIKVTMQE